MIRYATRDDLTQIVAHLLNMYEEQGLLALDAVKLGRAAAETIDAGRCLVAEKDGEVIGTIGFAVAEVWYSDEKFIGDMWVYVAPDHRNSTAAVRMLTALKADAKERGMALMVGAVGKKLDGARLFRNFDKCGELFLMRA